MDLILSAIILGSSNTEHNKLKITLGEYAQVYIGTTNITKQITVGATELRPSNEQGGNYFMSLATGKHIHTHIYGHSYQ